MNSPTVPKTNEVAITAAAKSVQGSQCDANEDSFLMDEDHGVFVLADGFGGQCGGERASRLAAAGLMREAELLLEQEDSQESLAHAMGQAFLNVNESIVSVAEQLPRFRGMGASAVLAIVNCGQLYVVGAGDCRAYLIRGDKAERLTVDQTLFQLLVEAGLTHDKYQWAHSPRMLWTCLGDPEFALPHIRCEEIQRSDRLILVTNGITRVVKDGLIGRLAANTENVVATATNVVNTALALRTADDATCLAMSFGAASPDSPTHI
ncbi:MAG: serine/threonine-protein phosphatase [Pirellulaceae bacterium]|jgi:protein phosphatase|nr:serine/threonine-protein phosphatase [Pirellulaceae bacterium]MDP6719673.1 serine/threonine-protein phosphatase [Pirellulaceae bacterium]